MDTKDPVPSSIGVVIPSVGNFYNSYMSMRRTKSEINIYESMG